MKSCSIADQTDLSLTVYNDGFGLVSEQRQVLLDGIEQHLQYFDVAPQIETDSLHVDGAQVTQAN